MSTSEEAAAATEPPPADAGEAAPAATADAPAADAPASAVDAAADALGKVGVSEPADAEKPDEPDLALKSEVLVEQEETVVEKKVVDDTPYASAKTFEELGSPPSSSRACTAR